MTEPATILSHPGFAEAEGWPTPGQWTWDDYLRLPADGQRYEIIEGVLYVSPAPGFDHQFTVSELARVMANFVKTHLLGIVLVAPFDVRLPGVANPVQPDLLFFRRGNEPRTGDPGFEGVPDLVVEVLSPGTRQLDRGVKYAAYEKAGVTEYWLVDTQARSVTVYGLRQQRRELVRLGRFETGDEIRSRLLAGFEPVVESLFPPPKR